MESQTVSLTSADDMAGRLEPHNEQEHFVWIIEPKVTTAVKERNGVATARRA